MKKRIFGKSLAVAVILLFLGLAIQPSIATVQQEEHIDVEPKNYLFQTIIDIANNPDVKNLLEQYKYDLFKVDIDRSVYRKILLRNPRLFFNTILIKPSMSIDYLNKCYNKGIELIDIIGEKKAYEMLESVEITNPDIINDLHKIVTNNKELSNRISTLVELNAENDAICDILSILMSMSFVHFLVFLYPAEDFVNFPLLSYLFTCWALLIAGRLFIIYFFYSYWFDCPPWPPV